MKTIQIEFERLTSSNLNQYKLDIIWLMRQLVKEMYQYTRIKERKILKFSEYINKLYKMIFVIKYKDKVIGCFSIKLDNINKNLTILDLIVNPEYRNKGIGTQAIEFAKNLGKEKAMRNIGLNVFTRNVNAINLYRNLGMKKVSQFMNMKIN